MATLLNLGKRMRPKERMNWVISDILRRLLVFKYELQAKITGRKYYCGALQGESEYNITINSDRTVSCNCQDYQTIGRIGDLRKQTFEEIFFGRRANELREALADGKIPIAPCVRCNELKRLPSREAKAPKARLPWKGIQLENTVRCNVDCIGCARENAAQLRVDKQTQMPMPQMEEMGDLLGRLGMRQIYFLNLGEPFLSSTVTQELPYLRKKNPDARILTSTNGALLNTDAKREAALNLSHIYFSVHGVSDEMLEKYMHRGHFTKAYEAMKAMAAYRDARGLTQPILEWKYLVFNWNDHPKHIEKALAMAKEAKVDFISFWPTTNPIYGFSWRWRLGHFKHIGVSNWKGQEVDLRPEGLRGTPTHPYVVEAENELAAAAVT